MNAPPGHSTSLTLFIQAAVECGKHYLGSGGPTSRLEEKLSLAGQTFGIETEVYGTPTGIFVSGVGPDGEKTGNILGRIKESSINLSELERMERLIQKFSSGALHPEQVLTILEDPKSHPDEYPRWMLWPSSFFLGLAASLPQYGNLTAALLSGVLATLVYAMTFKLGKILGWSVIFQEFFCCIFVFLFSAIFSMWTRLPPEAFAVGGLSFIVPGLTLTTAISELADQNFVSGTAKIMKGVLTLLAIAIAYLLIYQIGDAWFTNPDLIASAVERQPLPVYSQGFFFKTAMLVIVVTTFSLLFQVPRKALPWAVFTGAISWIIMSQFEGQSQFVLGPFMASLSVGLVSLLLGKIFELPSQIYSVPGILSLVPGFLAFTSFHELASGSGENGIELGFRVALIGGAIVFGLFTARLPFLINPRRKHEWH